MFGCWETLHVIKAGMEASGYAGAADRAKLIEAVEAMTDMPASAAHPQGPKVFNGKTHQVFGQQYITKVTEGKLILAHTAPISDTLYPDEVDYTSQALSGPSPCRQSAAETPGPAGCRSIGVAPRHWSRFFSSTMITWVGVSPTFSPIWVCASDHMMSPALNSRIMDLPPGSVIFRRNGSTA